MIVLFEDNHLLALDKPTGLLTQDSGRKEESLESLAREWVKQRDKKSGNVYLHAVHRLDRSAQGIVLFAKSSKALKRLQQDLKGMGWQKEYLALVEGDTQQEGVLRHLLIHGEHRAEVVTRGGKEAVLSFERIEYRKGCSLLRIKLETGRYHQIRVQLAAIGHPIVGDVKYGGKRRGEKEGISLLHSRLELMHPVRGEKLVIESSFAENYREMREIS